MVLGAMTLALSACLSPAPPEGAPSEIDEMQRAFSLDDPAPPEGAPQLDPCPCTNPVCRPGCTSVIAPVEFCTGSPKCSGPPPPAPPPSECSGTPNCNGGIPPGVAPPSEPAASDCSGTPNCNGGIPPGVTPRP
jgi:hypothetical protein